jgi:hypothetical protein
MSVKTTEELREVSDWPPFSIFPQVVTTIRAAKTAGNIFTS